MIPKIIHYLWLGKGEMPKIAKECIESWKKFCPDFEIKRWDETNLDLNKYDYVKESYNEKKYAFASDVLRLEKLYEYGGIYFDVDVKIIKPIDELLNHKCFTGFEAGNLLNPGIVFGTEPQNEDLKNLLNIYKEKHFVVDGKKDLTTICEIVTNYYEKFGLIKKDKNQELKNITVYSSEYFSPINIITNKKKITPKTYSVHLYNASWFSPKQKVKKAIKKILNIITFGLAGKLYFKIQKKKDGK